MRAALEIAAGPGAAVRETTLFGLRLQRGRWLVLGLGSVMHVCLGSVYSWSVFALPLRLHFARDGVHLGQMQLNLPFLVFLACFTVAMLVSGRLYGRSRPRVLLLAGSVMVGLGWLLTGLVLARTSQLGRAAFPGVIAAYGVVAGSGVGTVYGGPLMAAARWFPDRSGLAAGVSVLGFGISTAVVAPLANLIIRHGGVVHAFAWIGGGSFLVLSTLSLLLRFPPEGWLPPGWTPAATRVIAPRQREAPVYATLRFWSLWVCFLIGSAIGLMAVGISKTIAVDADYLGLSDGQAMFALSLFALPSGLGRVLFGWMVDRSTVRSAAIVAFLLAATGSVGMLLATRGSLLVYVLSFSLFWMTLGGWLAIAPAATGAFWGTREQPRIYGLVFSAYGVGAIFGNLLSGVAGDVLGSLRAVFLPVLVLSIVGMVVALLGLALPPGRPSRRPGPPGSPRWKA